VRLALLSDLHGNPIALDAVLADIEADGGGVDGYLVLGDLVAIGYDPAGVLQRLVGLPGARFVQGNTDRYVVSGQRPYPTFAHVAADTTLIPRLVEVAHSFAWTQGVLTSAGWLDWLAALPLEQRLDLPDGTRVLATHVAPGQDDGAGIHPALSDAELSALVGGASADMVCAGHTHWPLDRTVDGIRSYQCGQREQSRAAGSASQLCGSRRESVGLYRAPCASGVRLRGSHQRGQSAAATRRVNTSSATFAANARRGGRRG
jgi:predicted phosphodiesterase